MKSFLIFYFQQSWPWAFTSIKCCWYLTSIECHSRIIELRNIRRSGFLFEKCCTFFKGSTWVDCGLRQLQNMHLYLTVWSMTFHLDQMTPSTLISLMLESRFFLACTKSEFIFVNVVGSMCTNTYTVNKSSLMSVSLYASNRKSRWFSQWLDFLSNLWHQSQALEISFWWR